MTEPAKKRKLPVLQQAAPEGEVPPEDRPASQWVVASAIITVLGWLVLAGSTNAILQRVQLESAAVLVLVNIGAVFLAALGAGVVTARYGLKATQKHATYGTVLAAGFGWMLSMGSTGGAAALPFWIATLALLGAIAWSGGAAGYRLGRRLRPA